MTAQELCDYANAHPGVELGIVFHNGGKDREPNFDRGTFVSIKKRLPHQWRITMTSRRHDGAQVEWIVDDRWECPIELIEVTVPIPKRDYPHVCPRCGAPAYIGFAKIDCSAAC